MNTGCVLLDFNIDAYNDTWRQNTHVRVSLLFKKLLHAIRSASHARMTALSKVSSSKLRYSNHAYPYLEPNIDTTIMTYTDQAICSLRAHWGKLGYLRHVLVKDRLDDVDCVGDVQIALEAAEEVLHLPSDAV